MSDELRDKLQAAYMCGLGFARAERTLGVKAPPTYEEALKQLGWKRELVREDYETVEH